LRLGGELFEKGKRSIDQKWGEYAGLRAKGIYLPASDLLIATAAHAQQFPLLAKDAHFEMIRARVRSELKTVPNGSRARIIHTL
jgi:predicted nucleic acid-binding protein